MSNINILDCTLRDGGRIIDCAFNDEVIVGIGKQLKSAGIDIIEIGFLRDGVSYKGDSTFFDSVCSASEYVRKICSNNPRKEESYVLFVDYGLYDVHNMEDFDRTEIDGIRYGFTKRDFLCNKNQIKAEMEMIKAKGYDLYFQDVNTNGYEKAELIELILMANEVMPVSFGIVDTYGSMYLEDLEEIWNTVDAYLEDNIAVDFHSHNNMQMSFALAQSLIRLIGSRRLIIDATLNGMGKCAGNLNTELIVDYVVRKKNYDYDMDAVFDAIDRYLYPLKKEKTWGYSVPTFMAGVYKAHPNNIIYLTEKYRLNSKDIKYIILGIGEAERQRYKYDTIREVYKEYNKCHIDDSGTISLLRAEMENKKILILAPGRTVEEYHSLICEYIKKEKPIVISVNYKPQNINVHYAFYANTIYWEKDNEYINSLRCIVTSNIHTDIEGVHLVDYSALINEEDVLYDNSTIMLLNLLKKLYVKEIYLAGFDGLRENAENYVNASFPNKRGDMTLADTNKEVKKMYKQYKDKVSGKILVSCLTPSMYEEICNE